MRSALRARPNSSACQRRRDGLKPLPHIKDELGDAYTRAFEGMQIEASDGKTVMVGPVADQARLRGILNRISSLNLVLLSIDMLPDTDSAGTAS